MPRFVALLRGVNVGRGKRVPMAELRVLLEQLGYTDVRTLLNSGNAVFASPARSTDAHATRIRDAIAKRLDVDVPVIVKSQRDIAAVIDGNALAKIATDHSRYLIAFTRDAAALADLDKVAPLVKPPEKLHRNAHALYLWCASGILESKAASSLLGPAGRAATTRNWATVLKIAALLDATG